MGPLSDAWRDTYDEWKLRSPEDDAARYGHLCFRCGSEDQTWRDGDSWLCADCIDDDLEAESVPAADIEDLEERCGA